LKPDIEKLGRIRIQSVEEEPRNISDNSTSRSIGKDRKPSLSPNHEYKSSK
jgi:hypothetical protein